MNNKLKYNIKINQNNKENIFDLQLFGSVSNPYTFTLDGNYNINATIESIWVDLSYYGKNNGMQFETEIPQENLDYLNSGLHATAIDYMFYDCGRLTSIPNLNIDTSRATSMKSTFEQCQSLTYLDLTNFNISSVTTMNCTFKQCSKLTSINISNWDTSKVTNMGGMFAECRSLNTINGIIDMKSCTWYIGMFNECENLRGVKIKNPPAGFDGEGLHSSQYTIVS